MKKLNVKLSRNIPIDKRDDYIKHLNNSLDIIQPINLTLKQEMDKIIFEKTKENDFENAGWAYKQAYLNGQIQAYNFILSIFKTENADKA